MVKAEVGSLKSEVPGPPVPRPPGHPAPGPGRPTPQPSALTDQHPPPRFSPDPPRLPPPRSKAVGPGLEKRRGVVQRVGWPFVVTLSGVLLDALTGTLRTIAPPFGLLPRSANAKPHA